MWLVIESGPEVGRSARIEGEHFEGERVTEPVALNGDETIRVGDDVLLQLSLEEPAAESLEME
jgi:hypothetical protein